ncbi:hypothetical protein [Nocardia crassostreae]|uniref:hypothetical protein n=1 Tax=Nocardia crassostreae TaxID=53428 RepID=UPI0008363A06|nr:hypothetical protein [Nocardia crassostreae]
MSDIPYRGSGPYCYSNCLAMMMGAGAPDVGVIETVTGSAFGMQLVGGELPFLDPFGWDPGIGIDDALRVLGWGADVSSGGSVGEALGRLMAGLRDGPVMVGPVEMGHLRYQPGMTGAVGADHFLVVLAVDDTHVTVHDPEGFPYARMPVGEFITAWQGESVDYGQPFTMRTNFVRRTAVDPHDAVRAIIPRAIEWLSGKNGADTPPGSLGNGDAAHALAAQLESGCPEPIRAQLVHFAIRVGAHRLADAATCLHGIGHTAAAAIATEQARLVGALQYALVTEDDPGAADLLRTLAPTYDRLRTALENH